MILKFYIYFNFYSNFFIDANLITKINKFVKVIHNLIKGLIKYLLKNTFIINIKNTFTFFCTTIRYFIFVIAFIFIFIKKIY